MESPVPAVRIYRNQQVKSVTIASPGRPHRHLRTAINTGDQVIVLQEAVVAAIVRGYTTIKTHPEITGVHMVGKQHLGKQGYATWQLLEDDSGREHPESIIAGLVNDETLRE